MQNLFISLLALLPLQRLASATPVIVPTDNSKFTFYTLPAPLSGPCDLCEGTDGALWGQDQLVNDLFRIDPNTGAIQTFTVPFTLPQVTGNHSLPSVLGRTAFSCAIRPGADGNIYSAFGTRNQLVRINPTTKKIDIFTPSNVDQPVGNLQPFNDLYSASNGIYFTQTTANLLSFFDFKTEKITSYAVPTLVSDPLGTFVDSQGFVWIAELTGQKLAKFDPSTKKFTEYTITMPDLLGPAVIRAETEGRYIWFTAFVGNSLGRFDKQTNTFAAYPNPLAGGLATEDTKDGNGNIWFSSAPQNVLSKVIPSTGQVQQVVLPGTTQVGPVSVPPYLVIAVNYGPDNAIWFTEELENKVGRYSLS